MSPLEAMLATTRSAAELLGVEDDRGTIEHRQARGSRGGGRRPVRLRRPGRPRTSRLPGRSSRQRLGLTVVPASMPDRSGQASLPATTTGSWRPSSMVGAPADAGRRRRHLPGHVPGDEREARPSHDGAAPSGTSGSLASTGHGRCCSCHSCWGSLPVTRAPGSWCWPAPRSPATLPPPRCSRGLGAAVLLSTGRRSSSTVSPSHPWDWSWSRIPGAAAGLLVVVVPAGIVVFQGARPGTRRDLANSFAQVAQVLVLVPAAAYVSGEVDLEASSPTRRSPPPISWERSWSFARCFASAGTRASRRCRWPSTSASRSLRCSSIPSGTACWRRRSPREPSPCRSCSSAGPRGRTRAAHPCRAGDAASVAVVMRSRSRSEHAWAGLRSPARVRGDSRS